MDHSYINPSPSGPGPLDKEDNSAYVAKISRLDRLKRHSVVAWNNMVSLHREKAKVPMRDRLRSVAPLRFWAALLIFVVFVFMLLVYIVVKEDKVIQATLDKLEERPGTFRGVVKPILILTSTGIAITGINAYMYQNVLKQQAAAAAAMAIEAPVPVMSRRFPMLNAILPSDKHEFILYAINFFFLYKGLGAWTQWKHSPVRNAIQRWQKSGINRMLRNRELRRQQRLLAKQLATQGTKAAAFIAKRGVRGGALSGRIRGFFKDFGATLTAGSATGETLF